MPNLCQKLPDTKLRCNNERVKAPDHALFAYHRAQLPEGLNPAFKRRDAGLEALILIVIERDLEIIVYSHLIEDMEIRDNRLRVLGPEDYHPGIFEGNVNLSAVERVVPDAVAPREAVKEPFRVKSGNVRRPACRDDDRSNGLNDLPAVCCDFYLIHCSAYPRCLAYLFSPQSVPWFPPASD